MNIEKPFESGRNFTSSFATCNKGAAVEIRNIDMLDAAAEIQKLIAFNTSTVSELLNLVERHLEK